MATEFKLPELGENVTTGDVIKVLVKPGDRVTKDQPVMELETDKATIEVPSDVSGVVNDVRVKAGDKVQVGQVLLLVDESPAAQPGPATSAPAKPEAAAERKPEEIVPEGGQQQHVNPPPAAPRSEAAERGRRAAAEESVAEAESESEQAIEEQAPAPRPRRGEVVEISRGPRAAAESEQPRDIAPAAPSVRRLARELGVDINEVPGTGPGGRVSPEDVKQYARQIISSAGAPRAGLPQRVERLPDFSKWGEVERLPMSGIRRKTAEHLSHAWAAIPHVTQFDRADITALEEARQRFEKRAEQTSGKPPTITAVVVKVAAAALKVFPELNSSVDMESEEIIHKKYIHIGVAVDTERGLLVPVIRNADQKNIVELSRELAEAAERARNRKITLEEMEGGSFTITNLGGIGGTYFTPIVNSPEAAILGVSRSSTEPVFANGHFVPRLLLPLSLSYDHRVVDGAHAIRFLRWVAEALENPFLMALEG